VDALNISGQYRGNEPPSGGLLTTRLVNYFSSAATILGDFPCGTLCDANAALPWQRATRASHRATCGRYSNRHAPTAKFRSLVQALDDFRRYLTCP